MPQKQYKIIDNSTGESFVISSDTPPTKQFAKQVLEARKKTKREGEQADYDYENRPLSAKVAESLYGASEYVAPKVLAPGEKQTIPQRIGRKAQQIGSSLLDPANVAVVAPAVIGGPVGLAASSIVGGAMMLKDAPETLRRAYEEPSLENSIDLGVNALGLIGAAHGGMESGKSFGKGPISTKVRIPDSWEGPRQPIIDKSRLLESNNKTPVIDAEFVEQPQIGGHVREAGGEVGNKLIEGNVQPIIDAEFVDNQLPSHVQYDMGGNDKQKLLPKRGEKPIRGEGFTAGAPKVIIPTTERPVEVDSSGKIINESTTSGRGEKGRFEQKRPTGFQIMKDKGLLNDEEVFPIEEPEILPIKEVPKTEIKVNPPDVHAERELTSTARMIDAVNKNTIPKVTPNGKGIKGEIQNEWLRQTDTKLLQTMRDGAPKELQGEIDRVLSESNQKPELKEEGTKDFSELKVKAPKEEPKSKLDEAKEGTNNFSKEDFNTYQSKLDELVSLDTVTSADLRAIADLGKKAGLDADTVESDLIDNTPRLSNNAGKSTNATKKAFGSERGGVKLGDIFPEEWFKKDRDGIINKASDAFSVWKASLPRLKPEDNIGKMGEAGKRISAAMEDGQFYGDRLKGKVNILIHDAFSSLTPREIGQRIAVLDSGKEVILNKSNMDKYVTWEKGTFTPKEGVKQIKRMRGSLSNVILDNAAPATEAIGKAAEKFRKAMDILHTEGESSGVLTILDEGGKKIPFKAEGADLWSRDYTKGYFDSLLEGTKEWNKLVKEMAVRHGVTLVEAEKALKIAKESGQYSDIVTRADHKNILKQDSFVIDPNVVFDHVNKFSGRVGMAEALGPNDINSSILKEDLAQLKNEGFNSKYVEDTIKRLIGKANDPIPGKWESNTYRAITDLNNARLMTSFIVNNLANVTTTVARVGGINTMKGLGAMLGNLEMSRRMATLSGSVEHVGVLDNSSKSVSKMLGVPQSERFMRTWADQSGRITANGLIDYLREKNISQASFLRGKALLDTLLGKDSLESINRGQLLPEELDRAGWQLAKDSQAIINPATLPPLGEQIQTAPLRLAVNLGMQYKRMAMLGMSSLTESFRLNPARTIATILITAPIVGEVIGDAGSAIFGAGAGVYTGEGGVEGAIRDVNDRGKSLNKALKPLLQKKFGLSNDKAFIVSRYIEDLNRGFALGLIGDILFSTAYNGKESGPDTLAGGIAPAWGLVFDISKDIMKDEWSKMFADIAPQRPVAAVKRSQENMKGSSGGIPTVKLPSLPSIP